nr:OB-fold nucleic acid binding domain-containing protein [Amylibacter sp.]
MPSHTPWPKPPHALPHNRLTDPPQGARITVAGLVLVRQRPGTAKGVIFLTLEDETGISNIIVWQNVYQQYRRAVISGRLLRVTGKVQRDGTVVHVIAQQVEDISHMLDQLIAPQDIAAT